MLSISKKINGKARWDETWTLENVSLIKELASEYASPESFLSTLKNEIKIILRQRQTKCIVLLLVFNLASFILLLMWCSSTQSLALQAYSYTVGFNLLSLLTCILSVWVGNQKCTAVFTFGYERFEVLAVFASTVLAQLGSLFIIKESVKRLVLDQPDVHIGRLMFGAGLAFLCHVVVTYGCKNSALDHVIAASSSSWLQEHVSDISQTVCSVLPVLSTLLLPRVNPMVLIASAGAVALCITDLLIQFRNYFIVDTLAAMCISSMMCATMLPMSVYSGKILLQTTPSHIVSQLDKCLRETLTIDGVLEFRNEHFWMLSFGKMAGSLQVRVRRDANEQVVLAHVVDRLSNLVSVLTVQVFKDEWTYRQGIIPQPTATSLASSSTTEPLLKKSVASNNVAPVPSYQQSLEPPVPSHATVSLSLSPSVTNSVHTHASSFGHQQPRPQLPVSRQSPLALATSPGFQSFHNHSSHRNYSPDSHRWNNPYDPVHSTTFPQDHRNNLLISGTRTLDAEKFFYQPR
ncbi:zinc transporter 6-like isoform X2 [Bacillus rossius redtenbacheri]|uniref:zinc transporter 6-like isoform X2 n=1 Tax=Bacillus rossius redtenbacheri TaxID=93214 RepID=UPI002FDEAA04